MSFRFLLIQALHYYECRIYYSQLVVVTVFATQDPWFWRGSRILTWLSKNQKKNMDSGFFRCNAVDPFFFSQQPPPKSFRKRSACRRMGSGMIGMRTNKAGRCVNPSFMVGTN